MEVNPVKEKKASRVKAALAFRLSEEAVRLLYGLAYKLGTNRTASIELAIRETAKRKGVS